MGIKIVKAQVPSRWQKKDVVEFLYKDPYQSRFSNYPIPLIHPTTGVVRTMAEFAEDVIGDSRFAVETENYLIFISRAKTSDESEWMFFPTKIISKSELKQLQK